MNPDDLLKRALDGDRSAADGIRKAIIEGDHPVMFLPAELVTPNDPKDRTWQHVEHGECNCVPEVGPSHCHKCELELKTGTPVEWSKAPCRGEYANSAYPRTCTAIAALGIDPHKITTDDMDVNGYWEIRLDEDGKRVMKGDEFVVDHREWPSLSEGIHIIDLYIQERAAQR